MADVETACFVTLRLWPMSSILATHHGPEDQPPDAPHQIKKLKRQLGAKLVERQGNRNIQLTDAGQPVPRACAADLAPDRRGAGIARRAARGEVRFASTSAFNTSCRAGVLLDAVSRIPARQPGDRHRGRPHGHDGSDQGASAEPTGHRLARPPQRYPTGLQGFLVYRQRAVLALPANHRLAKKPSRRPISRARSSSIPRSRWTSYSSARPNR